MSEIPLDPTTQVIPGTGTVVRYGGVIGFAAHRDSNAVAAWCAALAAASTASDPGAGVAAAFEPAEPADVTGAALILSPAGAEVVLVGEATVCAHGPQGTMTIDASDEGVVRQPLVGSYAHITIGAHDNAPSTPWLDLREGSVPGGGCVVQLTLDGTVEFTGPVLAAHGTERAEDEPAVDFESIDLLAGPRGTHAGPGPRAGLPVAGDPLAPDLEQTPGGVEVSGLRCSRGHFNHPQAANCVWCGINMLQASHVLVRDERPPLGVLVIDGQASFTLDADYVIGRQPSKDPGVDGTTLRELVLTDPDRTVSRVHAAVRLDDWDVIVEDRGSGNGTWYQSREPNTQPLRLAPGQPRVLDPGDHVFIGPHRLTYHSHHQRFS